MGNKWWLAGIICLAAACLAYVLPSFAEAGAIDSSAVIAEKIVEALEQSQAEVQTVEYRASLPLGTVTTEKEWMELTRSWFQDLGLPLSIRREQTEKRLIAEATVSTGETTLHSQCIAVSQQKRWQAYLIVWIQGKHEDRQELETMYHKVSKVLEEKGNAPQFSTCIRGIYSDKMSDDQQESKISTIFATLRAREIERFADETVTSISGYTDMWLPSISTGDQIINVQVATHVNSTENITEITVGTPIITAEY